MKLLFRGGHDSNRKFDDMRFGSDNFCRSGMIRGSRIIRHRYIFLYSQETISVDSDRMNKSRLFLIRITNKIIK